MVTFVIRKCDELHFKNQEESDTLGKSKEKASRIEPYYPLGRLLDGVEKEGGFL